MSRISYEVGFIKKKKKKDITLVVDTGGGFERMLLFCMGKYVFHITVHYIRPSIHESKVGKKKSKYNIYGFPHAFQVDFFWTLNCLVFYSNLFVGKYFSFTFSTDLDVGGNACSRWHVALDSHLSNALGSWTDL